jgi:flagellar basal-body rod modification protein FlgD
MQNMNTTLNEIKMGQKPSESYQALNLLGKSVAGDSSRITRNPGDKEHLLEFELPLDSSDVSIKIRNGEGTVVRTYDLKNLKKGPNKVTWNGLDEKATSQPEGEYHASIEGKTAEGKKVAVKTEFEGVITGVNYTKTGPVLLVGNQAIHMRDVKKIIDPSLMKNDQKIENAATPDLKKTTKVVEDKKSPQTEKPLQGAPAQSTNSILNQVALSREMMDKLAKETKETAN